MLDTIAILPSKEYNKIKQLIDKYYQLAKIKRCIYMNLTNLPLHKMCIDKSSFIAEQDANHTLTADLTKDVFRKQAQDKLENK